jgi:hypothetical protein
MRRRSKTNNIRAMLSFWIDEKSYLHVRNGLRKNKYFHEVEK